MIKINGQEREDVSGKTVAELLTVMGYKTVYVAVELNGQILKRDKYSSTIIKDGDIVEVVNFVGGGN